MTSGERVDVCSSCAWVLVCVGGGRGEGALVLFRCARVSVSVLVEWQ